ncbi:hypothetical protein V1525DRAFT_405325 [Lipomyces kononenkoae]|uniref:Uncharacterized protein n=1 Tax=Lipomyces kononenkoae TaxID=34357 RepID=A0ACC3T010_LIPKO
MAKNCPKFERRHLVYFICRTFQFGPAAASFVLPSITEFHVKSALPGRVDLALITSFNSGTTIHGSVDNLAGSDIVSEEPASQVLEDTSVADSTSITEGRRNSVDKEIRYQQSGCTWTTFNSVRGTSTSNMKLHLHKHSITSGVSVPTAQRSI